MPAKTESQIFTHRLQHPSSRPSGPSVSFLLLAIVVIASGFAVSACSSTSSKANTTTSTANAMAPALKLALGTLKLDETGQAIDAASAAQLLPLWQLLDELDNSSATAPAEVTAVVEQIETTMTAAQLQSISKMGLTERDVDKASGSSNTAAGGTTSAASASAQQVSAAGPIMGGDPPAGGGVPLDGGGAVPGAGSQSTSSSKSSSASTTPSLIKQVIQMLEHKVQS